MRFPRSAADAGAPAGRGAAIDVRLDDSRVRVAALLIGVVAVSAAAILVRVAAAPAVALAFWRTGLAAVALAPFALRAGVVPRGRERLLLVVSGVLLAAHFTLWFVSLQLTTVASSSVLVAMSPLVVGAGSSLLLAEPPTGRAWAGLGLAVAGAAMIAAGDLGADDRRTLAGDGLAFAAAVAAAGYLLAGRHARRRLPVSVYATWTYGVAAAVLGVVAAGTTTSIGLRPAYDATTWWAIAGLVIGPQLLGHTMFNLVLARVSATVVAIVIIAEPVGATVLAAVLLHETPGTGFYLGAPLVLAGVLAAARRAG